MTTNQIVSWTCGLALAAALVLVPQLTHAYSVQPVGTNLSATTNQNLYRLRAVGKTWQLSSLAPDQIGQTVTWNNQLFFTTQAASSWQVYASATGLDYQAITPLSGDAIELVIVGNSLVATVQTGSTVRVYQISSDFSATELTNSPLTALGQTNQLFMLNNQLYYAEQFNSFVRIYRYQSPDWIVVTNFTCANPAVLTTPLVGINCGNAQIFYPVTDTNWQPLFPVSVQNITESRTTVAASDGTGAVYVWQNSSLTTYALSLAGRTIQQLKVLGSRVFIQLSDQSWWELNVTSGVLMATPGDLSNIFSADNADILFGKIGATYYQSASDGNWQLLTTAGDFTNVWQVPEGFLAWQQGGSVAQFAPTGSTAFQKMTTSWAASSQIQVVYGDGTAGWVLLLNSSRNPNLYETTDYQAWSRLTLPTAPTVVVPINQARQLPANALVEVSGIISVPAGVVGSEELYLQDATGGIQIYLDSTKGSLPAGQNMLATADGQISTSQTKRIVLSAADDLALGDSQTLALGQLAIDQLTNNLGLAVITQAVITSSGSGYYNLQAGAALLKLHFAAGALNFAVGSMINVPLVTDYNSASGQAESWYLGQGATLISAPASGSTATVASASSKTAGAVVAPTAQPLTLPTATKVATVTTTPTIIAAAGQPAAPSVNKPAAPPADPLQTTAMSIGGFLSGALAIRGRRFQRWLGL